MPSNTSAWYMNSLPLKFLFLPFKAIYTLFLIVLLIFGSSVLTQNYFGTGNLLEDEIKWSESVGHDAFPGKEVGDTINLQIARLSYKGLKTVFFDLTLGRVPNLNKPKRALF
ncbi:traD domain protein [Neisseria meningitidis]|uniref:traD domain protein n=1 Tax=Neisseria meningitidis TaxID=487 RepID=UPI000A37E89B|nr:traD domain protein [Neisseria meningitidis]MBJ1807828.1 traD domain protein [Neisseria meningitidis]